MNCGGSGRWIYASLALALSAVVCLALAPPPALGSSSEARQGGTVRVALRQLDVDSLDPALSYSVATSELLFATCARLLSPDLRPEVAIRFPQISRDRKTHTFTLRTAFRFSDGAPVEASAFARAINRTLAPGVESPWSAYTREIVGAEKVVVGKTTEASGVIARGNTLVVRFKRPVPDFPAQTASFLCAVPPSLPADPEGVNAFPAAPYYVSEYRAGERVVIRRNPFYGGKRPQRVDGFLVDLGLSSHGDALDRIERGDADWGFCGGARILRSGAKVGSEVWREQIAVLRPARAHLPRLRVQHLTPAFPGQPAAEASGELRDRPPRSAAR
jgi:ABC-type transport system substrate-binding protein